MKSRHRLLAAGTALILLAGLAATRALPASAAEAVLKDPRGDRVASVDWTRLSVENTSSVVRVRMTFVNLPARGLRDRSFGELYFFANATIETYDVADWRHYSVTARRDSSGRTTTGLSYRDATGDSTARCPGLKVRWSAGRGGHVSMVVPRSCMQVSRTLAISASSGNPVVNRLWDSTTKKAIVSMD